MADQGRFLTGGTMGHVVRMTATGAMGITFVFVVDAANLLWISQLGDPRLVAAIGFAYAVQFFSVSIAVGMMIATTAVISRSIGTGAHAQARRQASAGTVISVCVLALVVAAIVGFRHELVGLAGATGDTAQLASRYLAITIPSLRSGAHNGATNSRPSTSPWSSSTSDCRASIELRCDADGFRPASWDNSDNRRRSACNFGTTNSLRT